MSTRDADDVGGNQEFCLGEYYWIDQWKCWTKEDSLICLQTASLRAAKSKAIRREGVWWRGAKKVSRLRRCSNVSLLAG